MNEMFKRIAALLEGQALRHRTAWAANSAGARVEQMLGDAAQTEPDFLDTDIAVAWLCDASNKTRTMVHKGKH